MSDTADIINLALTTGGATTADLSAALRCPRTGRQPSPSTISRWRSGRVVPRPYTARRIVEFARTRGFEIAPVSE